MLNQFDYFYPTKLRFQAEEVSFNNAYEIVTYDKSGEPDIGNTHEAVEYATVYHSDGTISTSYNYSAGSTITKYLLISPHHESGQEFKIKPNAGYTINLKHKWYDEGWQEQTYQVTPTNPLTLPADSLRLEFLSITKEDDDATPDEEIEVEPDQTDDGEEVTISTQTLGYQKPEDEEVEADNKGIIGVALVGIVMVVAVIWSFTTE